MKRFIHSFALLGTLTLLAFQSPLFGQVTSPPSGGQTFSILHSFTGTGTDGSQPQGGLVQGYDGNFYGTTYSGGSNGSGSIFRMTPAGLLGGVVTTIYNFTFGADGGSPEATLTRGPVGDDYLFGTTEGGGVGNGGTIFTISPNGVLTTLYSFTAEDGVGYGPSARLTVGIGGLGVDGLYGTTSALYDNPGTIFHLTAAGQLAILHTFTGYYDGAGPSALVEDASGNFFGTTFEGGGETGEAGGTVFEITPSGTLTTLYTFAGAGDGENPSALIEVNGNFFGESSSAVFEISPQGQLTILHTFDPNIEGYNYGVAPSLIAGSDGNLYGLTNEGVNNSVGVETFGSVFKITPGGVFTALNIFSSEDNPQLSEPVGALVQGTDGKFYGCTEYGGSGGDGAVFVLSVPPVITSAGAASGIVGTQFSYQITAADGATEFYANGLPPGLIIDSTTGAISGTPTQAGQWPVVLGAENAAGAGTAALTLTISGAPVPWVITSPDVVSGVVGTPFSYQITATGGPTNYYAVGLPPGLTVDGASGLIAGTPTEAAQSMVVVEVGNGAEVISALLTLTVTAPPVPEVTLTVHNTIVASGLHMVGKFVLHLSSPQPTALMVNYAIRGSAVNGTDYVLLTGRAEFQPGQTTTPIKIYPLGDLEGAGDKLVKIRVKRGTGYRIGTAAFKEMEIVNSGLP